MFCCAFRNPDYYQLIEEPIDLSTIEKNILSGHYKSAQGFDRDLKLLFANVEVGVVCAILFWCRWMR